MHFLNLLFEKPLIVTCFAETINVVKHALYNKECKCVHDHLEVKILSSRTRLVHKTVFWRLSARVGAYAMHVIFDD